MKVDNWPDALRLRARLAQHGQVRGQGRSECLGYDWPVSTMTAFPALIFLDHLQHSSLQQTYQITYCPTCLCQEPTRPLKPRRVSSLTCAHGAVRPQSHILYRFHHTKLLQSPLYLPPPSQPSSQPNTSVPSKSYPCSSFLSSSSPHTST